MVIRPEAFRGKALGVAQAGVDRVVPAALAAMEVVMMMPARDLVPDVLARHGYGDYLAGIQQASDCAVDSGDSDTRNCSRRHVLEFLCTKEGACPLQSLPDCPPLSCVAKQTDLPCTNWIIADHNPQAYPYVLDRKLHLP